jgi:diguanylate cyclase (GGDEF)-like protein
MLRVLVGILGPLGEVVQAEDGETALRLLAEQPIDLVLLDVDLPGMSGLEVCARIKADASFADLPILFLSGHHDIDTEARGLQAGAVDYIAKPPSPPIVQARVRTHLALRQRTRQLLRLASIDGLTGLANRRAFDQTLALEWRRAWRNRTPLSLAMIDIDYFKAYNDHYGHQAGDDRLRDVALALAAAAERPGELVARYGGEEFAAVLPFCDSDAALAVAEKMRQRVDDLALPHPTSPVIRHVTISCGVATLAVRADDDTVPSDATLLLGAADQALYAAKAAGRNRVARAPG